MRGINYLFLFVIGLFVGSTIKAFELMFWGLGHLYGVYHNLRYGNGVRE